MIGLIKNLKLWHIVAIAFVVLLIYAGYVTERNKVLSAKVEERSKELNEMTAFALNQKEATKLYINKYRQQVARVKEQEISLDNVNRLLQTKEFEHLKQMEGLKSDNRNLKASLSYYASLNADSILLNPFIIECDSNKLQGYKWAVHDEFNDIDVILLDSTKKPRIDHRFDAVIYEGRRQKTFLGLRLGKRELEVEATNRNKLFPVTGLEYTVIRSKRKD